MSVSWMTDRLVCQIVQSCTGAATHIDDEAHVYCDAHAERRLTYGVCRPLTVDEMTAIEAGQVIGFDGQVIELRSQSARDAQRIGYGLPSYWLYLDVSAQEKHDYFAARGDQAMADEMLDRTISQALVGNDGD